MIFFTVNVRKIVEHKFVRNFAISLANRATLMLAALLASVCVARGLGVEARGEYAYIITAIMYATQFSLFGLHSANVVFVSRDVSYLQGLFANSIWVSIVLGVLAGTGLYFWDNITSASLISQYTFIVVAIIILQAQFSLLQNLLLGINRIVWYNVTELLPQLCMLCFLVMFSLTKSLTVTYLIYTTFFVALLSCFLAVYGLKDALTLKSLFFHVKIFWQSFSYGWRVYIACLSVAIMNRLEIFYLTEHGKIVELGAYSIALGFFTMTLAPAQIMGNLLLPRLSQSSEGERAKLLKRGLAIVTPCFLVLMLVLYVIAPWFIIFMYGQEYLESVSLFRILLLGFFPLALSSLLASYIASWQFSTFYIFSPVVLIFTKCIFFEKISVLTVAYVSYVHIVFLWLHFFVTVYTYRQCFLNKAKKIYDN